MKYSDEVVTVDAWSVPELLEDFMFSGGLVMPPMVKEGIEAGVLFFTLSTISIEDQLGERTGNMLDYLVRDSKGVFFFVPERDFEEIYISLETERYIR